MNNKKLEPCAYCFENNINRKIREDGLHYRECNDCGAIAFFHKTSEEADEIWNCNAELIENAWQEYVKERRKENLNWIPT